MKQQATATVAGVQFLRFVAALAVVLYHADVELKAALGQPPSRVASVGASGVHIFFVISGFIMYHASVSHFARSGEVVRFLQRRIVRIYPIYWIAALLYLLAAPTARQEIFPDDPAALLGGFLLVPGYQMTIIPPGWTLSYELYFYMAFAIMLLLPRLPGMTLLIIGFAAAICAGVIWGPFPPNGMLNIVTSPLLAEFIAGIIIAMILQNPRAGRLIGAGLSWAGIALSAGLFAVSPMLTAEGVPAVIHHGVPSVLLVGGFVGLERADALPRPVRTMAWLGDSSYALYLIHMLVLWLLVDMLGALLLPAVPVLVLVASAAGMATVAGLGLYYVAERPVLRFLRRHFVRPRPRTAQ